MKKVGFFIVVFSKIEDAAKNFKELMGEAIECEYLSSILKLPYNEESIMFVLEFDIPQTVGKYLSFYSHHLSNSILIPHVFVSEGETIWAM